MEIRQLELIEAACAGDVEAIEALLLQHHPTLTRLAYKYCATPEDVEDAVQETLWIASQRIGSLRVAAAFVSWTFQIVKRECLRLLRRYKNSDVELDEFSSDEKESGLEKSVLLKCDVVTALTALPFHYRQVLVLRDVEGLSAPETAAQLGV